MNEDEIVSESPVDKTSVLAQEMTDLRFVTKWTMVIEGIDADGDKTLMTIDSGIPYWDRVGMLEHAHMQDKAIIKRMVSEDSE